MLATVRDLTIPDISSYLHPLNILLPLVSNECSTTQAISTLVFASMDASGSPLLGPCLSEEEAVAHMLTS